jgi:DNA invertase Pin-like site-specific DNA recombinase
MRTSTTLLATYTEIESGKRRDGPELAKALDHCKLTGAVLVVAKLDRLARDIAFIANLMKAGAIPNWQECTPI